MERWKKKKIVVLTALFGMIVGTACAQQPSYIKPGLLTASTTLSPAMMLNRQEYNYYVTGFLEARLDKHISLRGETHYLLGNAPDKFLKTNLRTFFGMQYGFPVGNLDLHMGFQPGCSIMESYRDAAAGLEVVPSLQLNAGLKYYVWKYFNFFANISYIHASLNNLTNISGKSDELMLSAGLGLNLQVLKKNR